MNLSNFSLWLPVIFLVLLSIVDIKTFHLKKGFIPSALTTTSILVCFIFYQNPVMLICSLIMGLLLFDLMVYDGEPDLKMVTACGCVLPTVYSLIFFTLLISFISVIYKVFMKKAKFKEVPFIPVLLISYIGTILLL